MISAPCGAVSELTKNGALAGRADGMAGCGIPVDLPEGYHTAR